MFDLEISFSPICCGMMGALSGIVVSFCVPSTMNGCLPVILGSGIGVSTGCIFCIRYHYLEWKHPEHKEHKESHPVVIRNMYDNQISGQIENAEITGEEKK